MARPRDAAVVPPPPGHIAGAGDLEALAESMTLELGQRSRETCYHCSPASVYRTLVLLRACIGSYPHEMKALSLAAADVVGACGSLLPSSLGSRRAPFLPRRDHDRVPLGKSRGKSEISPKEIIGLSPGW
jgi:hypothetical protein